MVARHQQGSLRWLTGEEVAWLAGLLEGEGCFSSSPGRLEVALAMTDRDVVERARDLTGVGHVNFRKRHNPDRKDQWAWRVRVLRDAAGIMQAIRPHMGERRRARIDEALAAAKTPTSKGSLN